MSDDQPQSDSRGPSYIASWSAFVWIAVAGFVLYGRTVGFGLTYLDDDIFVKTNFFFNTKIENLIDVFTTSAFVTSSSEYYRPLLNASFILNAMMSGLNPAGYHLFNVLLHVLAACLFFRLLMTLGFSSGLSLFGALIFTVHPLLAQAVAWIPGRNDSLLAVFVFSSLTEFVRWQQSQRWQNLSGHLLFLAAALFTKESAVALLPVCAAYVLLGPARRPSRQRLAGLGLCWLALVGGWFLVRSEAIRNGHYVPLGEKGASILSNAGAMVQSFGKVLFPFNLSVFPIKEDTTYLWGVLALLVTAALVGVSRTKRLAIAAFGAVFCLAFLAPGLTVSAHSLASPLMEQRMVLPLAGVLILLLETHAARHFDLTLKTGRALALFVLVFFGSVAFVHAGHFKDKFSFWQNAVQTSPHSPLVHAMQGEIYRGVGRFPEAEAELKKSLELNPNQLIPAVNLSVLYVQQNRLDEAERLLVRALALKDIDAQDRQLVQKNLDQVRALIRR